MWGSYVRGGDLGIVMVDIELPFVFVYENDTVTVTK